MSKPQHCEHIVGVLHPCVREKHHFWLADNIRRNAEGANTSKGGKLSETTEQNYTTTCRKKKRVSTQLLTAPWVQVANVDRGRAVCGGGGGVAGGGLRENHAAFRAVWRGKKLVDADDMLSLTSLCSQQLELIRRLTWRWAKKHKQKAKIKWEAGLHDAFNVCLFCSARRALSVRLRWE